MRNTKRRRSRVQSFIAAQIDALEPRRLLTFTVNATSGNDTIYITAVGIGETLIEVNTTGYDTFDQSIVVNCLAGNDVVTIDNGVHLGEDITVAGGLGDDSLNFGVFDFGDYVNGTVDFVESPNQGNDSISLSEKAADGGDHDTTYIGSTGLYVDESLTDDATVNYSDNVESKSILWQGSQTGLIDWQSPVNGLNLDFRDGTDTLNYGASLFQTGAPMNAASIYSDGANVVLNYNDSTGGTTGYDYSASPNAILNSTLSGYFSSLIANINTRAASSSSFNQVVMSGLGTAGATDLNHKPLAPTININGSTANDATYIGTSPNPIDLYAWSGTVNVNVGGNYFICDQESEVGATPTYFVGTTTSNFESVVADNPTGYVTMDFNTAAPSIFLNCGTTSDFVGISGSRSDAQLIINGSIGDDTVSVYLTNPAILPTGVTFNGGSGVDTIIYNDSNTATGSNSEYRLFSTSLWKAGQTLMSWGSDVEHAQLTAANDNNLIRVLMSPTQLATVHGGGGNDSFTNIPSGQTGSSLTAYTADAALFGDSGTNTATLDDTKNTTDSSYFTSLFQGTGLTGWAIAYTANNSTAAWGFNSDIQNVTFNENNNNTQTSLNYKVAGTAFTLNGGTGNNTINVGNGDFSANGCVNTTIIGGGGNDSLLLDDHTHAYNASLPDTYNLYLNEFAKDFGESADVKFFSFSNITMNLSAVNDTQTRTNTAIIYDIASGVNVTVNCGARIDNVSAALGDTGDLHATTSNPLTLNGLSNGDSVTVNDSLNTDPRTYTINPTSFSISTSTGAGLAVNYPAGDGSFALNCGDGSDAIILATTSVPVTINGNGGNNTYKVGSGNLAANLTAPVTVNGGSGADNLIFDDSTDTLGTTQTFAATTFTSGSITDSISSVALTTILSGPGGDSLKITRNTRALTFTGNTGKDIVTIGNGNYDANMTAGSITVNGAGGIADTVTIDDRSDTGNDTYNFSSNIFRKGTGNTPAVTINNFAIVGLLGNTGNNQINIDSVLPIIANGEVGNDTFDLESTGTGFFQVNPNATVIGGSGSDIVTVNTTATNGGRATASFVANETLASLTIGANGSAIAVAGSKLVLNTKALTFNSTISKLDLNDNDLLLDYSGSTQLGTVVNEIKTGRASGAWTGNGITSSSAKNNAQHNTTLGAMEATDYQTVYGTSAKFDAQTLDTTAVLVKYTYYGDADFNGRVDGSDYAKIDATFGREHTSGNIGGWFNGDFDFSTRIDGSDYALIDAAFGSQGQSINPPAVIPSPNRTNVNEIAALQ